MPSIVTWGLNGQDAWPEKVFLSRGYIEKDYAKKLYQAKILLKEFYYGQMCGFHGTQMPSPGFIVSQEHVDICISKIDKEWIREQTVRGGQSFKTTIKFADSLSKNQKLSLIELLLAIFPNWPKRLIEAEQRQLRADNGPEKLFDEPL